MEKAVSFLKALRDYRDKAPPRSDTVTLEVTESYARKVLRLKKSEPLFYRGLRLKCIGSKHWRREQQGGGSSKTGSVPIIGQSLHRHGAGAER